MLPVEHGLAEDGTTIRCHRTSVKLESVSFNAKEKSEFQFPAMSFDRRLETAFFDFVGLLWSFFSQKHITGNWKLYCMCKFSLVHTDFYPH